MAKNNPRAGATTREPLTRQEQPDGTTVKPDVPGDVTPASPGSTRPRRIDLESVSLCAHRSPEKFKAVAAEAIAKVEALGLKPGKAVPRPEVASLNVNVRSVSDFVRSVGVVDKSASEETQKFQRGQQSKLQRLAATLYGVVG